MNIGVTIKIIAQSFPAICFVGGLILLLGSFLLNFGFLAGFLGFLLMVVGIGIYVLYLYWNRR